VSACIHRDNELQQLRRWKAEAIEVLSQWEQVWEAAGRPGPLGGSKAQGVHDLIGAGVPPKQDVLIGDEVAHRLAHHTSIGIVTAIYLGSVEVSTGDQVPVADVVVLHRRDGAP
jgi:hypothetical protein